MTTRLEFQFAGRVVQMPCIVAPIVILRVATNGTVSEQECRPFFKNAKERVFSLS